MKKTLLFLILLVPFTLLAKEDALQSLFKNGNDQYAKGAYEAALKHYKDIEKEGYRSAELYFNLGNTYFKLDSLAAAILYYERARLLAPADEDILFNLDLANQKTVDRVDRMPVLFIKDWWQKLSSKLSLEGWSFIMITFIWVSVIFFAVYFLSKKRTAKMVSFSVASVFLVSAIITFIVASSLNNRMNNEKEGIIFYPTVTIKSAPATGKELFVLHEGTKVRILEHTDGWVKIRLGNGNVGWLPESGIQGI